MPFLFNILCLVPFDLTSAKFGAKKKNGDVAGKKMYEKKELKTERGRKRETKTSSRCQGVPQSAERMTKLISRSAKGS